MLLVAVGVMIHASATRNDNKKNSDQPIILIEKDIVRSNRQADTKHR